MFCLSYNNYQKNYENIIKSLGLLFCSSKLMLADLLVFSDSPVQVNIHGDFIILPTAEGVYTLGKS